MKATESIGYKRWCEKFNLEQMSQTLIFIEKHQLTVDKLRNIVKVNANAPNEIKSEIATLDRKLDNISEMQRHLGTLNKTKHIHKQYRESPNPSQFWQDNYNALTAHSEASKYFNENGYDTWGGFEMPKFADTQKWYAEISADKKKLWARYHAMKSEMSVATNAWANVKTLLNVQDEIEIAPKVAPKARRQSGPSL
jgi:septation ring formation regulator EzrA